MNQESEVISPQLVACDSMCETHSIGQDPPLQALLIIYTCEHVDVRCPLKGYANKSGKLCVYEG